MSRPCDTNRNWRCKDNRPDHINTQVQSRPNRTVQRDDNTQAREARHAANDAVRAKESAIAYTQRSDRSIGPMPMTDMAGGADVVRPVAVRSPPHTPTKDLTPDRSKADSPPRPDRLKVDSLKESPVRTAFKELVLIDKASDPAYTIRKAFAESLLVGAAMLGTGTVPVLDNYRTYPPISHPLVLPFSSFSMSIKEASPSVKFDLPAHPDLTPVDKRYDPLCVVESGVTFGCIFFLSRALSEKLTGQYILIINPSLLDVDTICALFPNNTFHVLTLYGGRDVSDSCSKANVRTEAATPDQMHISMCNILNEHPGSIVFVERCVNGIEPSQFGFYDPKQEITLAKEVLRKCQRVCVPIDVRSIKVCPQAPIRFSVHPYDSVTSRLVYADVHCDSIIHGYAAFLCITDGMLAYHHEVRRRVIRYKTEEQDRRRVTITEKKEQLDLSVVNWDNAAVIYIVAAYQEVVRRHGGVAQRGVLTIDSND